MIRATSVAALLLCLPCLVTAQGWQGSVTLTTDYVQRGISQSDGDPALQASVAYRHAAGWYAGAWASNVDTANRYFRPGARNADLEVDLFAGYAAQLGSDWQLDAKSIFYFYPDDPSLLDYDYVEFSAGLTWRDLIHASVSYAPEANWHAFVNGARDRPTYSAELSLQQPLSQRLTWSIGAGYRELVADGVPGYLYGSASLALQWRRVSLELGWFTTDRDGERLFTNRLAGNRVALTATLNF